MVSPQTLLAALRAYRAHRADWDNLCDRCGRCCYEREVDEDGTVIVNYAAPCEFLDEEARLCRVYENRFAECSRCHKLTVWHALFSRHLPPSCAYVRTFRREQ